MEFSCYNVITMNHLCLHTNDIQRKIRKLYSLFPWQLTVHFHYYVKGLTLLFRNDIEFGPLKKSIFCKIIKLKVDFRYSRINPWLILDHQLIIFQKVPTTQSIYPDYFSMSMCQKLVKMAFNWVNMQVKPFLFSQVFFVTKRFLITKNYQTLFLPIRFFAVCKWLRE